VVPVDEVIDAIKDEEEAQLTVRKRSVASANDADPLKRVARSLSLKTAGAMQRSPCPSGSNRCATAGGAGHGPS
jgi:hypothetical protein